MGGAVLQGREAAVAQIPRFGVDAKAAFVVAPCLAGCACIRCNGLPEEGGTRSIRARAVEHSWKEGVGPWQGLWLGFGPRDLDDFFGWFLWGLCSGSRMFFPWEDLLWNSWSSPLGLLAEELAKVLCLSPLVSIPS